jgi:hypothetical protein
MVSSTRSWLGGDGATSPSLSSFIAVPRCRSNILSAKGSVPRLNTHAALVMAMVASKSMEFSNANGRISARSEFRPFWTLKACACWGAHTWISANPQCK